MCDDVAEATGRQRCGAPRRLGAVRCPCSRSGGGELVPDMRTIWGYTMDTPWVHHDTSNKACGYSPMPMHVLLPSVPGMIIEYHRIRLGWILGWRTAKASLQGFMSDPGPPRPRPTGCCNVKTSMADSAVGLESVNRMYLGHTCHVTRNHQGETSGNCFQLYNFPARPVVKLIQIYQPIKWREIGW